MTGPAPRRILVIVNPRAGREARSARRLRRVAAELERCHCEVVVRRTCAPADAERLAREAEPDFDLIVAAGGDGTVNEVVNGLAGSARPLAVLPLGTGNVLASEIGLPRRAVALARIIADGAPHPVWPGRVGGRLFVAMTGIGFDAEVLGVLDHRLKGHIGKLAFAWAILISLHRYRRREFVVEADGSTHRAASAIILRGRFFAGRFVIAPQARLADRRLRIVLFRRPGRLAALRGVAAMLAGALHRLPEVSIMTATEVRVAAIEPDAEGPFVVQIDGEIGGRLPIVATVATIPLFLVQP